MSQLTSWNILTQFIKKHPRLFVIYCILVLAMPINEVILPQFYGKVLAGLKGNEPVKRYLPPIVVLLIIVQVMYFSSDLLEVEMYPKFHAFLRDITLDYVVKTKSTNLSEIESGKLIAKMVRFPAVYTSFIDDFRNAIVPYFLIYFVVFIYTLFIDKQLSVYILIISISTFVITFISMHSCNKHSQARDAVYYKLFDQVDEILRNIISVLNNNRYDDEKVLLDTYQNEYVGYCKKALYCVSKFKVITFALFGLLIYLFIKRVIMLYRQNSISHATLISLAIIILFFFGTIMKNASLYKDIMYRYGTITECLQLFNHGAEAKEKEPMSSKWMQLESAQGPYCLELENVGYSYDMLKMAVDNVNIKIKCLENVAIVGEIGSGKSTLLKLLMKYKRPTKGELYLNGIPYTEIPEQEVRAKIGYSAQNSILFNRSLMENILYSNKSATREEVNKMIEWYGLVQFFKRFPNGLETKAGVNGSNLSGGEKQIVWILRVILQNPQIILLDEPTSAMDEATKQYILRLLMMVTKEKTVVCITHDTNILKYFDRVFYIKNGTLEHK